MINRRGLKLLLLKCYLIDFIKNICFFRERKSGENLRAYSLDRAILLELRSVQLKVLRPVLQEELAVVAQRRINVDLVCRPGRGGELRGCEERRHFGVLICHKSLEGRDRAKPQVSQDELPVGPPRAASIQVCRRGSICQCSATTTLASGVSERWHRKSSQISGPVERPHPTNKTQTKRDR